MGRRGRAAPPHRPASVQLQVARWSVPGSLLGDSAQLELITHRLVDGLAEQDGGVESEHLAGCDRVHDRHGSHERQHLVKARLVGLGLGVKLGLGLRLGLGSGLGPGSGPGLGLGLGLGSGLGLGLGLGMGGSTVCQCDTRGAPSAARDSTTRVWSRIRRGHMPTPEREVATSAETCLGLALGSG